MVDTRHDLNSKVFKRDFTAKASLLIGPIEYVA